MKRPLGLTIISGLMTFIGGVMTLIMLIEVFDAVRFLGFYGISIESPEALFGFLLYGIIPILFYAIGIGLFLGCKWAYALMLKIFPILFFLFLLSFFVNVARYQMYFPISFSRLIVRKPQIVFWAFFFDGIIVWPLLSYLKLPYTALFFEGDKN